MKIGKINWLILCGALLIAACFAISILQRHATQGGFEKGECRCYCSDVCGPRDVKEDDTPYVKNGICFCKPRDERNYRKNGCHRKPKPQFKSCCHID